MEPCMRNDSLHSPRDVAVAVLEVLVQDDLKDLRRIDGEPQA